MRSVCGTWESPWGLHEGDQPLTLREYFPEEEPILEAMEDFLQHNGVFYNGRSGRSAHMDSYGTLTDLERLMQCLGLIETAVNPGKKDWQRLSDAWLGNPNTGPNGRLLGRMICAREKLTPTEIDPLLWSSY